MTSRTSTTTVFRAHDDPTIDVFVRPSSIKGRYERMIVISHDLQVDDRAIDPETLFVTTDWLAWLRLTKRGAHSLHIDSALESWPGGGAPPLDHLLRATEWMYLDGVDATLFRGVSLGKLSNWEVAASYHAAFRVFSALDRLVGEFRPRRMILVDMRSEYDFTSAAVKRMLVRSVAERWGAEYAESAPPAEAEPRYFPHVAFDSETPPPSPFRRVLTVTYESATNILCLFRESLGKEKFRVLILQNLLLTQGLLDAAPEEAQPIIIAQQNPKSPSFVWSCLKKGIFLTRLPLARLTAADRRVLTEIRQKFTDAWNSPSSNPMEEAIRSFALKFVLSGDLLERRSVEVKKYEALFVARRPARILVGDSEGGLCRLLLELCRKTGTPADELPNGMFLGCQSIDARCGDGFSAPLISRFLAWGGHAGKWLRRIGSPVPVSEVGYPVVDILRRRMSLPKRIGSKHALVLPLHVERLDVQGVESRTFSTLVGTVRALADEGYKVRIKVHPGYHDLRYYDDIVRECSLDAEVIKTGTLLDHLEWADVVVGPVSSNAFIETLSVGRRYVPMVLRPTSNDATLVQPIAVADTVERMLDMVRRDDSDCEEKLRRLTGYDPGLATGTSIWSAMRQGAASLRASPGSDS